MREEKKDNVVMVFALPALLALIFTAGASITGLPVAFGDPVAETPKLYVSATSSPHGNNTFGGKQFIEIMVDDPQRSNLPSYPGALDGSEPPTVTIDDNPIFMNQAEDGKWYAYVMDPDVMSSDKPPKDYFLGPSNGPNSADISWPIDIVDPVEIKSRQEGGSTVRYGDESIIINYDSEISASLNVDRTTVPTGAEVHVSITDFRLNLDPTYPDVWMFSATGLSYHLNDHSVVNGTRVQHALDPGTFQNAYFDADWSDYIGGAGKFRVNDDADGNIARTTYTGLESKNQGPIGAIVFKETGHNTGVFESWTKDGGAGLTAVGDAGERMTISYGNTSIPIRIAEYGITVSLLNAVTWPAASHIVVDITDQDKNLDTKASDDMQKEDEHIPVMILGNPVTINQAENHANMTRNSASHTAVFAGDIRDSSGGVSVHSSNVTINIPRNQL